MLEGRRRDIEPTTSMDETGPNQEEASGGIKRQRGQQNLSCDGLHSPELGRNRIHALPFVKIQARKPVFGPLGRTDCATYNVRNQQESTRRH